MIKTFKHSRHYQSALLAHLKGGCRPNLKSVRGLGLEALAAGMSTLDLAIFHEQTLVVDVLPGIAASRRPAVIRRAALFFSAAITPVKAKLPQATSRNLRLNAIIETLSRRTVELASSNLELSQEIAQRKEAEAALLKGEVRYRHLLEQSDRQQGQAKRLARELLSAQEDERKKISRDLHDVIAQTLTGINLRLTTLKREAELGTKGIELNIRRTQKLVERAVSIVHRFARELRPALLDDLGLIPALQAFLKSLTTRTGIHTRLTAHAGIEQLDMARRTVLFRVAQEALTNVTRHAKATLVEIGITRHADGYRMVIHDDGRSFDVQRVMSARGSKRLGLIGMRERLAMVGGDFAVTSAPTCGTTVTAHLPLHKVVGAEPPLAASGTERAKP